MKHVSGFQNARTPMAATVIFLGLVFITHLRAQDKTPPPSTEQTKSATPTVKFIPYDTPPKPLKPIRPTYPATAREAKIEGTVIIQCYINEQGKVTETIVLKGLPATGLDEASIEAITKTPFSPAMQRGKPVGAWISIPVNFRLEKQKTNSCLPFFPFNYKSPPG